MMEFVEGILEVEGDEHLYDNEIEDDMNFWRKETRRLERENKLILELIVFKTFYT